MNRRHFLKFIPLIPIAIGLVSLPNPPKPAESVTKLEGIDTLLARQKAMLELMERTGTIPPPASGKYYSKEEWEPIAEFISRRVNISLMRQHAEMVFAQRVRDMIASKTGGM